MLDVWCLLVAVAQMVQAAGPGLGDFFNGLLEEAHALAGRLQEALDRALRPYQGTDRAVSASLGVAACQTDDHSGLHTLQRADAALYRAKRTRRSETAPHPQP